jgi:hypothetical protein
LSELSDPRVVGRRDHLLFDIIAMAVPATFCGADEWSEIEQFAKAREAWLRTFLQLPGGIPTDDTFRRVFARLDCKQFAAGLFGWMQRIEQATRDESSLWTARRSVAQGVPERG